MATEEEELTQRVCTVGGNAVSAFLSWRLSATNACDVTLVWKSGYEAVSQYGVSFRSSKFGNERFKPRHVVRSPEEAAGISRASFDYVVLCVKALPDVYDLASVIEPVVAPQHTCIIVNTTHALGIEKYLEERFPTNVVLSLVSGAEITQIGASEFEHKGPTDLWVGSTQHDSQNIPQSIQQDMAEALAMTLKSGQVDCEVSSNIRQQQYDRMIGPIAFEPASVMFETPSHADLLEKVGVRSLIVGIIEELTALAHAQGCSFKPGYREQIMEQMVVSSENSAMYQDFAARRPMEIETYLGSPMKLAQEVGMQVPRIETMYAMLHQINKTNQQRPQQSAPASPGAQQQAPPPPRLSQAPGARAPSYGPGPMNGGPMPRPGPGPHGRSSRAPSASGGPPPMRGGRPSMSGYPPRTHMNGNGNGNGYGPRGPGQMSRRQSFENNDLEEFSHLMLYDGLPEGQMADAGYDGTNASPSGDLAMRERELALRQKELALREREYNMGRRRGPPPPPQRRGGGGGGGGDYDEDEEDGEDYFDPMSGPQVPQAELENLDMMSVTSRRTRKAPSASQLRSNPEIMAGGGGGGGRGSRAPWKQRPQMKNRTSATIMSQMPGLHEELMSNPLVGYSSDRYGNVDRMNMGVESRTNSLTAERLNELQQGGPSNGYNGPQAGPYPPPGQYTQPPMSRRGSQSPGNPLSPNQRPPQFRPSPPNGYGPPPSVMGGPHPNGRPSPPNGAVRAPVPRHPPGHGNSVAPQQIEQQTNGVSNLYPPKPMNHGKQVRSLTGSASASAGSGDSNRSAPIDSSEPSAHSSSSSLGPRHAIGVR
ncbi:hypothetical protein LTR62_001772 [Meristemomyces frigidus]|uniref:2-dehydropantoate 2-reductase n=1 Tax=Meristemomyces frigidus TaxID=1508187 RepID=A0AAN7TK11_9PEZI|nr:hypothetical protein LTR62_001772 [Meristemomyces frigidus]